MASRSGTVARGRGPGRLSAAEAAQLPGRLLDAALTVFARDGYAGTTIDSIAREAGASRRTVYARFADKSEVLIAALERLLEQALTAPLGDSRRIDPARDARTVLGRLARNIVRAATDPQTIALNRLILGESFRDPKLGRLAIEQQARARLGAASTIEQLVENGRLRQIGDPQRTAAIFIEMVAGLPRRHAIFGDPLPAEEVAALTERALDMFLAAYGAPG